MLHFVKCREEIEEWVKNPYPLGIKLYTAKVITATALKPLVESLLLDN